MDRIDTKKKFNKPLPGIRRKSVAASQENWVRTRPLLADKHIPLLVEPAMDSMDLAEWAARNRAYVEKLLREHRALLFRNFNIQSVEKFESFVIGISDGELLEYKDRTTPRHSEGGKSEHVYISTVYPPAERIEAHNEGTYWLKWARKLFFCCLTAPEEGGETPIFDVRRVHDRIDPAIRQRFSEKGWLLLRNYNDGFGLPWQEAYQTQNKSDVESYCRANNIDFEWRDGEHLRTRSRRKAVHQHPDTGENVWFNHAAFYHHSSLKPEMREALLSEFAIEELPYTTFYGDGTPIADEDVQEIRQAYLDEQVKFPWQKGDVMLLDNTTVAHAREPYKGDRRIIVAMTEAVSDCS